MFPASTMQILTSSADRLVVFVPPYWSFGICFLILGLVIPLALTFVMSKFGMRLKKASLIHSPLAIVFSVVGLNALGSHTVGEFDRTKGELSLTRQYFFFFDKTRTFPLASLRFAQIETVKNTQGITLRQDTGQVVYLTNFSDRGGEAPVLEAIQQFMKFESPSK